MPTATPLTIQPLTAGAFEPYGWMLGKPFPADSAAPSFASPSSDFWREHLFDAGLSGDPEILWVRYRDCEAEVMKLEAHWLTEQAVVPLTGPLVQIVATSTPDGHPNLESLAAFKVPVGEGICMRPRCWHATRALQNEVTCLMLTRRSTTFDLAVHLLTGAPAGESAIRQIPPYQLVGAPGLIQASTRQ
ncbi:ureidoglycolate lyase [Paraburkholderia sp. GAS32]|jgi:ureidoglycolate lyase|uniref:ureidoglycolate lyase n=1 Tax=Paraburkholderia sp. GAS32 TaxID=3035129 RepID=UPI003D1FB891